MKLRPALSLRYDMFDLASPENDMFPQAWSTLSGERRRSAPRSPIRARARLSSPPNPPPRIARARAQASARAATRSTASTTTT